MVSLRLRRLRVVKIFAELLPKDLTVLGACLSSVPLIDLQLVVPLVLALMVGIPVAWVRPRASAVLSSVLAPYCSLLKKFSRFIFHRSFSWNNPVLCLLPPLWFVAIMWHLLLFGSRLCHSFAITLL